MSYEWLLGVVVGLLLVIVAYRIKRKSVPGDCDERTAVIRGQAAASAFYLSGGFVLLGWLGDNALAYREGAPPRIVSAWSAMLAAMLCIYLGSALYKQWQFSVWTDLDPQEKRQARRRAAALFGGAAALIGSSRIALEHGQRAMGWFLIAFMCVEMLGGLFLLARSTKRSASH